MHVDSFLDGSTFESSKFERIQQTSVGVRDCEFYACTFASCVFSGSAFQNCTFMDCTFESSDLSNCKLVGCVLTDSLFDGCRLIGIDWTLLRRSSRLSTQGLQFEACTMSFGVFFGLDLTDVRMTNCKADDVDFGEAVLSGAALRGTDLARARFLDTDLRGADLRGAINYSIDPLRNNVRGTKVSGLEALGMLRAMGVDVDTDVVSP